MLIALLLWLQFTCPTRDTARWVSQSRASLPADTAAPLFIYYFNYTLLHTLQKHPYKGCFHGSELFLVFDFTPVFESAAEATLASAFVK